MMDCAKTARVPIDRNVVGRIGENHGSELFGHQGDEIGRVEGIADSRAREIRRRVERNVTDLHEQADQTKVNRTTATSLVERRLSSAVDRAAP